MSSNTTPSGLPVSMGPGAQPVYNPPSPADMVRQIQEMRDYYRIRVDSDTLRVGYQLNGQERDFAIPFDSAPLSSFQRWLLYGGSVRSRVSGTFLLDMMRGAENMIGRPLEQREAESFTLHAGKRIQYGFIGMAVALGTGYGMAARGYKEMKFPFKKVKPLENYEVFPLKRVPLITGPLARTAWQTTRFNVYAALSIIFLSPIFRSMGQSVMAVGLYGDTRTRETVKSIKGGFDRISMNRRLPGSAPPTIQSRPAGDSSKESDSEDFYARGGNSTQSYNGSSTNYSGDNTFSDSTTDTGALNDSTMRQRESAQSSPSYYGTRESYSSSQSQPQRQRSSSSDFFFDDASPTAGTDPDSPTYQGSQQRSSGGSAWARIRRGGPSSQSSSPTPYEESSSAQSSYPSQQQQQTRGSGWRRPTSSSGASSDFETKSDSFSFSSSDEQRALAKDQAQREFDAMLDRERRESGSGDYDRASSAAESGNENPMDNRPGGSSGGSAWDRMRRGNGSGK